MASNFNLAPPVKTVDGLQAVPIDIQHIAGSLHFDASTEVCQGDVTISFIMGDQDGCPVFDLRQTIIEAWLDGASIDPVLIQQHDFGGGANAELRIVESTLMAGSEHTLRLRYSLGPPQASTAGSYQPSLSWSAGPRLVFNFGFTDLGAGRYLESWVPANLIFDQYDIDLNLVLENTGIAHEMISNGLVIVNGANDWQVQWPDSSTALSTLLEIRAQDSVSHQSDSVLLPVSSSNVTVDAWKLNSNSANLSTQINLIKTFLTDNENDVGAYRHGSRFVAFFNTGGMEYDGGTTTGTGPLRHETFHSWWGRGIKPASQNDGWWDEAWTVYNMSGGSSSVPFDFTRAPVELSSRNPWNRVTPGDSYSEGKRVFDGLAAVQSAASLRTAMDAFYNQYAAIPVTTEHLETHLLCNIGKTDIVDGFHRFVYGFTDTAAAPDVWLKDHVSHGGSDQWDGVFWNSPDVWVRNSEDDINTHQNPEYGQDNWFYARVRNRSSTTARHFVVTFRVGTFAGMQFSFPDDFLPCTAATAEFDLAPGETRIVKARWPRALVPPEGTHACLLVAALCRHDHPTTGQRVWESNSLAQKNVSIVDLQPNDWFVLPFIIRNLARRRFPWFDLRLTRLDGAEQADVQLMHAAIDDLVGFSWFRQRQLVGLQVPRTKQLGDELLDCGGDHEQSGKLNQLPWTSSNPQAELAQVFANAKAVSFKGAHHARINLSLCYDQPYLLGLRIKVPADAKPGSVLQFHLAQRLWPWPCVRGGVSVEVRVREKIVRS